VGDVVQNGVRHDGRNVRGVCLGRTMVVRCIYTACEIRRNGRRGSMHGRELDGGSDARPVKGCALSRSSFPRWRDASRVE